MPLGSMLLGKSVTKIWWWSFTPQVWVYTIHMPFWPTNQKQRVQNHHNHFERTRSNWILQKHRVKIFTNGTQDTRFFSFFLGQNRVWPRGFHSQSPGWHWFSTEGLGCVLTSSQIRRLIGGAAGGRWGCRWLRWKEVVRDSHWKWWNGQRWPEPALAAPWIWVVVVGHPFWASR